jgi:YidC/Oxa1 family membrane protein insertase
LLILQRHLQRLVTTIKERLGKTYNNKGGYIVGATLKNMRNLKGSGQLVELIKDNNANLNVQLVTLDNRTFKH